MKKLLLSLALTLAFVTVTSASNKMTKTTLKASNKKEVLKTKKTQECITLRTDTHFQIVDGQIIWGETKVRLRIDWNCMGNPMGLSGI